MSRKQPRKYTKEVLEPLVRDSFSYREVAKKLGINLAGGSVGLLSFRIKEYGLDNSHFHGSSRVGLKRKHLKKKFSDILIVRKSGSGREKTKHLNQALIGMGVLYQCDECHVGNIYNGKKLVLQVDHKNGNPMDNRLENLHFLCPNCHSQTETFGFKKRRDYGGISSTG